MSKEPIHIVDVSARDGLQNEKQAVHLSAQDKVDYIQRLIDAGLTRIEAGSFVKPAAVPAMANSAEVAELLKPLQAAYPHIVFPYLVPNLKGLERAKSLGVTEVAVFLAVSEQFSKANINQTVDESFTHIEPVVKAALADDIRVRGYLSNIFGYDDLPFSPHAVAKRAKQLLDMGCYEVSLGDTTGICTMNMTKELITALVIEGVPIEQVAMHFHNTFGAAIGNVAMSYELGIRTFDASTGGLGGCPYANSPKGNLAMEDLVTWCMHEHIACDVKDPALLQKAAIFMREKLGK